MKPFFFLAARNERTSSSIGLLMMLKPILNCRTTFEQRFNGLSTPSVEFIHFDPSCRANQK